MEYLLVDTLIKIVRHGTDKHALCEITDFACRDKAVHLSGNGGGLIITIDSHGLPLLQNLSKPLRKSLGSLSNYLPTEHISYCILNYFALFVAIVTGKL